MKRAAILLMLVAGCDGGMSPDEKAASDARDIERVEAAQHAAPPFAPLHPQPVTPEDVAIAKLAGAPCRFIAGGNTLALAMTKVAFLKIGGALEVYAADSGSPPLPFGAWTHYDGKAHMIDLQIAGKEDAASSSAPGRLTVRDPQERVVFSATGVIRCQAPPSGDAEASASQG